jgi:sec-independent protein translocase protein TatA
MGELSPWHWLIVAVVVLVLFGSKKLPEAARSLGRSLRIFKSEVSSLRADDEVSPPAVADAPQVSINTGHSHVRRGAVGVPADKEPARPDGDHR